MTAEFVEQDMKTEEGYANVLSILESAKESGAAESRCHVAPLPGHEAGSAPKSDFEGETAVLAAVLVALFAFFVCVYRVTIKIMRRRELAMPKGSRTPQQGCRKVSKEGGRDEKREELAMPKRPRLIGRLQQRNNRDMFSLSFGYSDPAKK